MFSLTGLFFVILCVGPVIYELHRFIIRMDKTIDTFRQNPGAVLQAGILFLLYKIRGVFQCKLLKLSEVCKSGQALPAAGCFLCPSHGESHRKPGTGGAKLCRMPAYTGNSIATLQGVRHFPADFPGLTSFILQGIDPQHIFRNNAYYKGNHRHGGWQ